LITKTAAEEALQQLREGNERFHQGKLKHPRRDPITRRKLIAGQNPFAVILTCADSRVSPSVIFDKGLGDLFVIRNAGNVADPTVIGSIEFAVDNLGARLVVIMGHEKCGAVKAAIDGVSGGHIGTIMERIMPVVEKARAEAGDLLENTIRLHAQLVSEQLRNEAPVLSEKYKSGELKIIAAYYSLTTGDVEFLEELES
jgi:carbonic anhydrase